MSEKELLTLVTFRDLTLILTRTSMALMLTANLH